MSKRETAPHLRLIVDRRTAPSTMMRDEKRREEQLSFWYPESSTILLLAVAGMDGETFMKVLERLRPRWVIDTRTVPRFDILAASRPAAFKLFERLGATYVDLFGRLGIKSYDSEESNPAIWGEGLIEILKKSERKGPYVVLLDNERLRTRTRLVLQETMGRLLGEGLRIGTMTPEGRDTPDVK